jgi:hypothetical protein
MKRDIGQKAVSYWKGLLENLRGSRIKRVVIGLQSLMIKKDLKIPGSSWTERQNRQIVSVTV